MHLGRGYHTYGGILVQQQDCLTNPTHISSSSELRIADRSASLKPLSSFLLFLGAGDVEWEEEEEGMLAIDWMIWAMRWG